MTQEPSHSPPTYTVSEDGVVITPDAWARAADDTAREALLSAVMSPEEFERYRRGRALRREIGRLLSRTPDGGPEEPAEGATYWMTLRAVAAAIRPRSRLIFWYGAAKGVTHRRVEPLRLTRVRRHWYLDAWDLDRNAARVFRVDRMAPPHLGDRMADPRPVPRWTPRDDFRATCLNRTGRMAADLVLRSNADEALGLLPDVDGILDPLDWQTFRFTALVGDWPRLIGALALGSPDPATGLPVDIAVEGPGDFRAVLARAATRLGAIASASGSV